MSLGVGLGVVFPATFEVLGDGGEGGEAVTGGNEALDEGVEAEERPAVKDGEAPLGAVVVGHALQDGLGAGQDHPAAEAIGLGHQKPAGASGAGLLSGPEGRASLRGWSSSVSCRSSSSRCRRSLEP